MKTRGLVLAGHVEASPGPEQRPGGCRRGRVRARGRVRSGVQLRSLRDVPGARPADFGEVKVALDVPKAGCPGVKGLPLLLALGCVPQLLHRPPPLDVFDALVPEDPAAQRLQPRQLQLRHVQLKARGRDEARAFLSPSRSGLLFPPSASREERFKSSKVPGACPPLELVDDPYLVQHADTEAELACLSVPEKRLQ